MAEHECSPFGMVPRFETLKLIAGIPYTQTVNGRKTCNGGKTCGALRRHGESFSVYPLITITMRRSVIILSFTLIARKLREEFANKGFELYQNIYRDACWTQMCMIS